MITREHGRTIGESRKLAGMELAALHKQHAIKNAQLAMIDAALGREERTCTSDDFARDLALEYSDGGKWCGAAVRGLANANIIHRVGHEVSARPSRHGSEVKLWAIADVGRAAAMRQTLVEWLEWNPLPTPDDQPLLPFPDSFVQQKGPAVGAVGLDKGGRL